MSMLLDRLARGHAVAAASRHQQQETPSPPSTLLPSNRCTLRHRTAGVDIIGPLINNHRYRKQRELPTALARLAYLKSLGSRLP